MSSEHCHTFLSRKITISVSICFIFFTFFLIILFKVFKASLKWRRRFAKIIWIFGLNLGLNRSTNTVTRFYRENSNVLVRNHFIFQFFLQQKLVERLYLAWFSLKRVEMTDRIFSWKSSVFSQNSIELEQTRTYERKLKNMKISKHIFEIDCQKVLILCLKIYFLRKSTSQLKIILRVAAQSWKNSKTIYFREWISHWNLLEISWNYVCKSNFSSNSRKFHYCKALGKNYYISWAKLASNMGVCLLGQFWPY